MRNRLPPGLHAAWAAAMLSCLSLAMPATAAEAPPLLSCKMSAPAKLRAGAAVPLTFELGNRGKKALYVLNWNTPLEGFFGRYLNVTGPQGELEYGGAMVKRAQPQREEYVILPPGGKVAKTVNLASVYEFKAAGSYRIEFTGRIADATTGKIPRAFEQQTAAEIDCAAVMIEITGGK